MRDTAVMLLGPFGTECLSRTHVAALAKPVRNYGEEWAGQSPPYRIVSIRIAVGRD